MKIIGDSSGVIAVWKPAGLATQAPPGIDSAESWLRRHLHGDATRGYLGVPHRLDRAVSGVVLFAATPRAARKLSRQFERRQVRKTYRAIVACGPASAPHVAALELAAPEPASPDAVTSTSRAAGGSHAGSLRWEDLVLKIPEEARTRLAAVGEPQAREAVTVARFVRRLSADRLLLELEPVTGRMHQLRLQAATRGMPILGDDLYGGPDETWGEPSEIAHVADPRERPIALHAARITYADPDTEAVVTIEAPLPDFWPLTAR